MKIFDLPALAVVLYKLNLMQKTYEETIESGKGSVSLIPEQFDSVKTTVLEAAHFCASAGFGDAVGQIGSTILHLEKVPNIFDSSSVACELRHVKMAVEIEMFKHQFVQVLADRMKYVNQDRLFGEEVHAAFPSAAFDIREAGNCLAVESNVAAIYHLMCAVEYGLRAVAWDRRIKFPKGPVELHQWGEILKELDRVVFGIQQWPKSRIREAAHEFYNKALLEIRSFNDAYRRHIMHSRERNYSREDALAIFTHVKDFMALLATRISETKRTPSRWKGVAL
jgi:hypothetical protein